MRHLNVLIAVLCLILFLAYAILLSQYVSPGTPRTVTTIGLLFVIGAVAGAGMNGRLTIKLAYLAAIPMVHMLYEGVDPAKPGVVWLASVIELASLWIAAVFAHAARRLLGPTP